MTELLEVCYNVNSDNMNIRRQYAWIDGGCKNVKAALLELAREKYPTAANLWVAVLSVHEKTVNV